MTVYYRRENARRDAFSTDDLSDSQIVQESEKGDLAIFYRYTV